MKRRLILIFFLTVSTGLFSQNIKGKVFDVNSLNPLEGVHVYTSVNKEGTFSDENGKFKLETTVDKNPIIYFSHVGFILKELTLDSLKKMNSKVYLSLENIDLDEITLSAPTHLKPKIKYKNLAPMETGVYSFASTLVENKIYVFGGNASFFDNGFYQQNDHYPFYPGRSLYESFPYVIRNLSYNGYFDGVQYYDIDSGKWKTEDRRIGKRAYHRVNYNDNKSKLYVLGGKRFSKNKRFEYLENKIEVVDLKNDTIYIDKTNPHQAVNFESFAQQDNLIVLGGSIKKKRNGEKIYSDKVHLFDTNSGLWYELATMLNAKETKGVLVNSKIYLFGGFNGNALSEIEIYNLKTGKWSHKGKLFDPMSRPAIAVSDQVIYLFDDGKIITYHLNSNELKEYEINLFLKSTEMHVSNDKLYIVGGYQKNAQGASAVPSLISIDLTEFKITKATEVKTL